MEWLEQQKDIRVVVPIGVIYEVIASILEKPQGSFEKANKALDIFMTHKKFEIYYNTEESFNEAKNIFKKYKVFSLVDLTIVVLYINKKCKSLFSTDRDYDRCSSFISRLEFPV